MMIINAGGEFMVDHGARDSALRVTYTEFSGIPYVAVTLDVDDSTFIAYARAERIGIPLAMERLATNVRNYGAMLSAIARYRQARGISPDTAEQFTRWSGDNFDSFGYERRDY